MNNRKHKSNPTPERPKPFRLLGSLDRAGQGTIKSMLIMYLAPSDRLFHQFFKGMGVGLIATVIDVLTLWLLTKNDIMANVPAACLSFLMGMIVNYLLCNVFVFSKNTYSRRWFEFSLFLGIGMTGLGLNALIIWGFTRFGYWHVLQAKALSVVIGYFWNFTLRKKLLYS